MPCLRWYKQSCRVFSILVHDFVFELSISVDDIDGRFQPLTLKVGMHVAADSIKVCLNFIVTLFRLLVSYGRMGSFHGAY